MYMSLNLKKKNKSLGLPGGQVVKNPPANAENTGLTPGPGGSHAVGQLSTCTTTAEPATQPREERATTVRRRTPQKQPRSLHLDKVCTQPKLSFKK